MALSSDWDYKDDHFIAGSEHDQIFEPADYQELGAPS